MEGSPRGARRVVELQARYSGQCVLPSTLLPLAHLFVESPARSDTGIAVTPERATASLICISDGCRPHWSTTKRVRKL